MWTLQAAHRAGVLRRVWENKHKRTMLLLTKRCQQRERRQHLPRLASDFQISKAQKRFSRKLQPYKHLTAAVKCTCGQKHTAGEALIKRSCAPLDVKLEASRPDCLVTESHNLPIPARPVVDIFGFDRLCMASCAPLLWGPNLILELCHFCGGSTTMVLKQTVHA